MKQIDKYQFVKSYDELSDIEKSKLILPFGSNPSDFETFHVQYNKKGQICDIHGLEFTESKKQEIDEESKKANVLDWCIANSQDGTVSDKAKKASLKRIENTVISVDELVSNSEAADMLNVSKGRVSQLVNNGQLDVVEVAGRIMIVRQSVLDRAASEKKVGRPRCNR